MHDDGLNEKKKKKKKAHRSIHENHHGNQISTKKKPTTQVHTVIYSFFFYHGYHTLTLRATTLYSNSRYNIFHKGNHSRLLLEIKVVQSRLQSLKSGDGISQNRKKTTKCSIFCHISTDL